MDISAVAVHGRRLISRNEDRSSVEVRPYQRHEDKRLNDVPSGRVEMVFVHLMDGQIESTLSVGFDADGTLSVLYGQAKVTVREGRLWIDSDFGEVFIR